MIVGLTGKFAAGKGAVAKVLREQGFTYHSCSDVLREELARRGVPESRDNLREIGNELRRQGGPGVLAARILERLGEGDHVVDSIRNPAEVEELRRAEGFFLLGVDADQRVRFERLLARGRQGDPETFERFVALEERENQSDDPTTQQLRATYALADLVVMNDGTLAELRARVEALVAERR